MQSHRYHSNHLSHHVIFGIGGTAVLKQFKYLKIPTTKLKKMVESITKIWQRPFTIFIMKIVLWNNGTGLYVYFSMIIRSFYHNHHMQFHMHYFNIYKTDEDKERKKIICLEIFIIRSHSLMLQEDYRRS